MTGADDGPDARFLAEVRRLAGECTDDRTHIAVCPIGDHLRVARRITRTCARCDQPIARGNVGPATWDDEHTCGKGSRSFQHGCGEWNAPIEVTIDLSEIDVQPGDEVLGGPEEQAADTLDRAIRMLDDECKQAAADANAATRSELEGRIRRARRALDDREQTYGPLFPLPNPDDPRYDEEIDDVREAREIQLAGLDVLDEAYGPSDTAEAAVLLQEDGTLVGWAPAIEDGAEIVVNERDLPRIALHQ
jgi:hypothetical protein